MEKASSGGKFTERKSSENELLSKLKALAIGHCDLGVTRGSNMLLRNQMHRVRKLMALSNPQLPRRKRKLQQFLNDIFKSMDGVLAYEASMKQDVKKLNDGQLSRSSSSSYVLDMEDPMESLQKKELMNSNSSSLKSTSKDVVVDQMPSSLNVKSGCSPNKDRDIDCDRSTTGWDSISPTCAANHKSPSPYVFDLVHSADNFFFKKTNQEHCQIPRRRSKRLINFIGDVLQESVIRIGPDFQADIPKFNTDVDNGTKWLGTRVWPVERKYLRKSWRQVGKGRPGSCCCVSPGSSDCINNHIKEERLRLQVDLGPVFFIWKLDEMGSEISNLSKEFLD